MGGVLLAAAALAAAPWLLAYALRGRPPLARPNDGWLVALALVVALVTLAQWAWRIG